MAAAVRPKYISILKRSGLSPGQEESSYQIAAGDPSSQEHLRDR